MSRPFSFYKKREKKSRIFNWSLKRLKSLTWAIFRWILFLLRPHWLGGWTWKLIYFEGMWNNQLSHLSQFKEIIWKNYSYHSCKECYLQNWDGHKTYSRSFLTLIKSFNENLPSIILLDRWSEMAPLVNYNSQLFPGRKKGETMEGVISDIHHLSLLSDPTQISISSQFFILTITLSLCVGDS